MLHCPSVWHQNSKMIINLGKPVLSEQPRIETVIRRVQGSQASHTLEQGAFDMDVVCTIHVPY